MSVFMLLKSAGQQGSGIQEKCTLHGFLLQCKYGTNDINALLEQGSKYF
jgi:hypothetical protein